jgi:hypothetical protein
MKGGIALSNNQQELEHMPDKVKGKKIGDFAYYIDLESDLGNATIVAFKQPESEKKTVGIDASLTEAKARGKYGKENEGNVWDTIIVTQEYGILPISTWKSKAGKDKVWEAIATTSGGTSFVLGGSISVPPSNFYSCKNCGKPIVFAYSDGLCPSCGKKFTI